MDLRNILEVHFRLKPFQKTALKKLGILTIEDLLYHFPARYGDTAEVRNIGNLEKDQKVTVFGKITGLKTSKAFFKKIPMADATIEDESGKIKVVWFNQPYLAKMISGGSFVRADGKVSERKGELYLSNPKIESVPHLPLGVGDSLFGENGGNKIFYPVYPESRGITSNWFYHTIQKVLRAGILDNLKDPIPTEILKKYNLPCQKTAMIWIHSPHSRDDALSARKRFSFEEIFFIQLEKKKARKEWENKSAFVIDKAEEEIAKFTSRFSFEMTGAQKRAIEQIVSDFKKGYPMSRLLEGDVGSGKTAVAASTIYATVATRPKNQNFGNLQATYMCPTEILANQHFESFIKYFSHLPVQIGLITGSGCKKFPSKTNPSGWTNISRAQLLKWVGNGEIPILFGTHSLIQKAVKFKNLAYVVIDEQHRFGTGQRQKLVRKDNIAPHLLSMTATPIPRTLALTIYGDLDLTLLDELPAGRKPIITEVVLPNERENTYEKMRKELKAGRQAYVICPRIDEPDPEKEMAILAKSVTEEAKRLKEKVFPEFSVGVLHGKMKPSEKEKVMADFSGGKIRVLVATSVVEVGVNVPNATVIIIEGAERFGLAQLHQLRGRVLRSSEQAYCYVFSESKTKSTMNRLHALKTAKNGFELAEFDLQFRGAGDLYGRQQWGISDVAMEALKNLKMVEAARAEAEKMVSEDPEFEKYPLVQEELSRRKKEEIHFE